MSKSRQEISIKRLYLILTILIVTLFVAFLSIQVLIKYVLPDTSGIRYVESDGITITIECFPKGGYDCLADVPPGTVINQTVTWYWEGTASNNPYYENISKGIYPDWWFQHDGWWMYYEP